MEQLASKTKETNSLQLKTTWNLMYLPYEVIFIHIYIEFIIYNSYIYQEMRKKWSPKKTRKNLENQAKLTKSI